MGEYDGNSTWEEITNSRLSKNVLPHGTTLPTAGTNKIEPNGLFLKTDTGVIYENTGSLATPIWTKIMAAENAAVNSLVMTHNTTITDYTIPTDVIASSSKNTFEWKTGEGWVGEGNEFDIAPTVSSVYWNAGLATSGTLTFDLGSGYVSETAWEIRGKSIIAAPSGSSASPAKLFIGLSNTTGALNDIQDAIGFIIRAAADANTYKYANVYADGTGIQNENYWITQSDTTGTIWFKIQRTSAINFTITFYSDSTYTTVIESKSSVITSGVSGLRYLKFATNSVAQNVLNGHVEIVTLNPTAAAAPTAVLSSYSKDDNTGTLWTSHATPNPNLILDAGADVNLCGIAAYWDAAATTETEIKIQYATAAAPTSWIDVRKITESNLTGSAWNYIRFNTVLGRYLRIFGTTATAVVISIYEVKLYKRTDSQIITGHGHKVISATDTALALDGT